VTLPLPLPIQVAADIPFPFPMLNRADVYIGRQDVDELSLNSVFRPEFKTLHALDDLSVKLIGTEGFPVEHMNVRRTAEPTTHPRMAHHFRQWDTICRIRDEHSR
jgi:hypothetical protein